MNNETFCKDILETITEYMTQTERTLLKMTCVEFSNNTSLGESKIYLRELTTIDQVFWAKKNNPKIWNNKLCQIYAAKGNIEILKWLRYSNENYSEKYWSKTTCLMAAKHGQLQTLEWLRKLKPICPWNSNECTVEATNNGHLNILRWIMAKKTKHQLDPNIPVYAIRLGHLHIVKWLCNEFMYCKKEDLCTTAVTYEQIEILKWTSINAPSWKIDQICKFATYNDSLEVLKHINLEHPQHPYLLSNEIREIAKHHNSINVLNWLNEINTNLTYS